MIDGTVCVFVCVFLDAMQVEVTRTYTAKQPDELSLQVADVVLVSQTVEDGTLLSLFRSLYIPFSVPVTFYLPFARVLSSHSRTFIHAAPLFRPCPRFDLARRSCL